MSLIFWATYLHITIACGETATDDFSSAVTVLGAYCDQATTTTFPSPSVTVSQYISNLPAYFDLAPCAASGLAGVVM
jgi:hypothetical protein